MPVTIEVYGYGNDDCGPFPCDDDRTCGLEECYPEGGFQKACVALGKALEKEFGDRIRFRFTLLDNGIPDHIQKLVEEKHPPVPIVMVNDHLVPVGRISLTHIKKFLPDLTI